MNAKRKLLKFDLHMHTFRSDGWSSTKRMLTTAKKKGLDAVAITDHNILSELDTKEALKKYGIYIIPGIELSFLRGHLVVLMKSFKKAEIILNKWNLKKGQTAGKHRKKNIKRILRDFVDEGALVIAAHPKIPTGTMSLRGTFLAKLYEEGLLHGAEIHNDDLEIKFRKRFYRVWHRRAKKAVENLGIPAYSNSDAHFWWRIGRRFNIVELDDPSKLFDELKKGEIKIEHGTRNDL